MNGCFYSLRKSLTPAVRLTDDEDEDDDDNDDDDDQADCVIENVVVI